MISGLLDVSLSPKTIDVYLWRPQDTSNKLRKSQIVFNRFIGNLRIGILWNVSNCVFHSFWKARFILGRSIFQNVCFLYFWNFETLKLWNFEALDILKLWNFENSKLGNQETFQVRESPAPLDIRRLWIRSVRLCFTQPLGRKSFAHWQVTSWPSQSMCTSAQVTVRSSRQTRTWANCWAQNGV